MKNSQIKIWIIAYVCCRKICFLFLPSNTFHKIYYYSLFEIPKSCKTRLLLVVFKWAKNLIMEYITLEKKTLVTWPQWHGTEEFNLNDGNHIVWMTILCWTRCQMGLPTAQILKQSDTIFKRLLGNSLETCNLGGDKNYTVTSTYL